MRPHTITALAVLTLCPTTPAIENLRLSGTFKARGNQIQKVAISPDSTHVVYLADDDYDDVHELYTVPIDGGSPVKLHPDLGPPAASEQDVIDFAITGDSSQVVFIIRPHPSNHDSELFIAPIGPPISPANPTRLRPADLYPEPGVRKFLLTPYKPTEPQYVVFNGRPADDGPYRLYSVPVSAVDVPVEIGDGYVSRISSGEETVEHWKISPNAQRVAYVAPLRAGGGLALYSAKVNNEHSETWLNRSPNQVGRDPSEILITADSKSIVYLGDEMGSSNFLEVLSVPIDTPAPVPARLSPRASFTADASAMVASNAGNQIAYRWTSTFRTVPAGQPSAGARCRGSNAQASDQFEFIGDTTALLYTSAEGTSLRLCPANGVNLPALYTPPSGRKIIRFGIHPDGEWVSFLADLDTAGVYELYSLPLDRSTPTPVRINSPRTSATGDLFINALKAPDFQLTPNGSHIIYNAEDELTGQVHLFSAPARGGQEIPLYTSGHVAANAGFTLVSPKPDSNWVVFAADPLGDGVLELFSVPVTGGDINSLNNGHAPVGDVEQAWSSPDSKWVVYRADQDRDRRLDLYAVPPDGSAEPILLNAPAASDSHDSTGPQVQFSASSQNVFFLANSDQSEFHKLFTYDFDALGLELLSRPQDEVPSNSYVRSFQLHTDAKDHAQDFVIYLADHDVRSTPEFYRVGKDSNPVPLIDDRPPIANIDEHFAITPDGSALVFIAPIDDPLKLELQFTRLDTPNPNPETISGAILDDVEPGFQITPSGRFAVFRADAKTSGVQELFSVDLTDPSFQRRKLHPDLPRNTGVEKIFAVSQASEHVAFLAELTNGSPRQLLVASAGTESSATRILVEDSPGDPGIAPDFAFSPDGNWLVFRSNARDEDVHDLYKSPVPPTGEPAQLIASGGTNQQGIISFTISPDSYRVSYQLSHRTEVTDINPVELLSIPLDRAGPITRLNVDDTQHPYTNVTQPITYLADSSQILFADDRAKDETAALQTAFGQLDISEIPDQHIPTNATRTVTLTVSDFETRPERINVTTTSDDPSLVPHPPVTLTPDTNGTGRTVTITPTPDLSGGPVRITVTAEANGETANTTFNVTVGASEYETWIATFIDPDDPLAAFDADPDGDGLPNGAEWAKALQPLQPDADKDTFEASVSGNTLTLRHRRAKPRPSSLQTSFEWSADLTTGSWAPATPTPTPTVILDGGTFELIEHQFEIPTPIPTDLFLRATYSQPAGAP